MGNHKVRFTLQCLLLWGMATASHASCSWNGQIGPTQYSATNASITVNSLGTSIGSRVADIAGVSGTPSWQTQCSGSESAGYTNQAGAAVPAITNS